MKKTTIFILTILLFILVFFLIAEAYFFCGNKHFYFKLTRLNQVQELESRLSPWDFTNEEYPSVLYIEVENSSFENKENHNYGWISDEDMSVETVKGHKSSQAIKIGKGSIAQKITCAKQDNDYGPFVASAWIKTNTEKNAYISLEINGQKTPRKSHHPGDNKWHLISFVLDRINEPLTVAIILGVDKQAASFDEVKLILGRKQQIFPKTIKRLLWYRELVQTDKKERFRIITLGGSTTYGHTNFYETWPYILEQKLNTYHPGKFEVINLGIPGYSTRDILKFSLKLKNRQDGYPDLNPDLVIISPVWNDLLNDFALKENFSTVNQQLRNNIFIKKTALGYYVYKFIYSRMIASLFRKLTEEYAEGQKVNKESNEDAGKWTSFMISGFNKNIPCLAFKIRLEKIVRIYQEHGIRTLLLTQPCIWLKNTDPYQGKRIMGRYGVEEAGCPPNMIKAWLIMEELDRQIINSVSYKTKAKCMDLTSYFRNKYPTLNDRAEYFQDGTHFNLNGCTLLADYIYNSDAFQQVIENLSI